MKNSFTLFFMFHQMHLNKIKSDSYIKKYFLFPKLKHT